MIDNKQIRFYFWILGICCSVTMYSINIAINDILDSIYGATLHSCSLIKSDFAHAGIMTAAMTALIITLGLTPKDKCAYLESRKFFFASIILIPASTLSLQFNYPSTIILGCILAGLSYAFGMVAFYSKAAQYSAHAIAYFGFGMGFGSLLVGSSYALIFYRLDNSARFLTINLIFPVAGFIIYYWVLPRMESNYYNEMNEVLSSSRLRSVDVFVSVPPQAETNKSFKEAMRTFYIPLMMKSTFQCLCQYTLFEMIPLKEGFYCTLFQYRAFSSTNLIFIFIGNAFPVMLDLSSGSNSVSSTPILFLFPILLAIITTILLVDIFKNFIHQSSFVIFMIALHGACCGASSNYTFFLIRDSFSFQFVTRNIIYAAAFDFLPFIFVPFIGGLLRFSLCEAETALRQTLIHHEPHHSFLY